MKNLLFILPVMGILALIGGLIGSIFGFTVTGALIGALIPVAWVIVLVCFLAAMGRLFSR